MSKSIHPIRLNHMNVVLADFDASLDHFRRTYGAELVADMPQREFHACLVELGRVIFELFVPYAELLIARYGPHYLGVEYQADMDEVRSVIAARGIRIIRDIGVALHTHPADGYGMSFEFYGDYFHDRDWPLLGGPIKSADHWREHPLGLTGIKAYSVVVADIDAAREFFQTFLSAVPVYEEARPAVAGRAVGLEVSDAVVELITPVGDGALRQHLQRFGEGIRSTVFGVRDTGRARRYLAGRGVTVTAGDAPDTLAIPAEQNLGLRFEFSE